ncbi:histidinol-phosphate transaminase [Marisediminicola senii]|uniref:histidinol-phosphate transaminase n=1 Tax=Marisediminicola senii TaxID=2711233 RepID=UPI0013ED63E9|nr:histidinol-phosphate transaminase [Marisediminicola senii]
MPAPDETRVRLRPEIVALSAYRQGAPAPDDAFKLSSNENPFEPIPAVLEAIAASSVNRYPDGAAIAVRGRIALRHGIDPGRIHVGAGSVSVLAQIIQAAAGPGDEVIYAWRSFEAYPGLVTVAGATGIQVPLRSDATHDLAAMAAAVTDATRVILVCSPNNPTGTVVRADDFATFMAAVPASVIVVLDEAYAEFVTDPDAVSGIPLQQYPNLVVLRTFSKAYGLAGLRFGFAAGAEYILDAVRAVAIPLSVIESAQRAAIAALDNEDECMARVAALAERRDQVWVALQEQGWTVPRPQGNFVWLGTGASTSGAAAVFLEHGIVVRPLGGDGLRISIGEAESVEKLLVASGELVRTLPTSALGAGLD